MSKNTTQKECTPHYDFCKSAIEAVSEFHDSFGVESGQCGRVAIDRRIALFNEEHNETLQAIKRNDITEFLDGICDMLYIASGSVHALCPVCFTNMVLLAPKEVPHLPNAAIQYCLDRAKTEADHTAIIDIIAQAFNEVHRSNMSKLWSEHELALMPKNCHATQVGNDKFSVRNENSKICKPPSYSKPDLADLAATLEAHINL